MSTPYKVVDLFAGPGGLAEGFAALHIDGRQGFEIALSVEKEASAFATLRLRAFTRQFAGRLPPEYYDYISAKIGLGDLTSGYPREWLAACQETHQLELGASEAAKTLDPILDAIRHDTGGRCILVGGPPCQAYSLVGRARNRGTASYVPSEDKRHFLYKEYIRILDRLRPAVFVMENVKGFLSSTIDGERVFAQVLDDLERAGGSPGTYRIIPIVAGEGTGGRQYVVHAEKFGVPQRRHRVILVGLRSDIAVPDRPLLSQSEQFPTTFDVLAKMPKLRSGLSKSKDSSATWRNAVDCAFRIAARAAKSDGSELAGKVSKRLKSLRDEFAATAGDLPRSSSEKAPVANGELAAWLIDPELRKLPNHETRGHMESDLARYAFASAFADVHSRSPKASEFPRDLAPQHANWDSGKFADRFRVQCWNTPSTTITSHISKDGHYFIHPDPLQCRSLTVREAARLQTFPDNYFFEGNRTEQFVQVGNAVPPLLAYRIAAAILGVLADHRVVAGSRQVAFPDAVSC